MSLSNSIIRFSNEEEYLRQQDKKLKKIIDMNGHIVFKPMKKNQFDTLVGIVISQFISTKAANSIFKKIRANFNSKYLNEKQFQNLTIDQIKKLGLSTNKAKTINYSSKEKTKNKNRLINSLKEYNLIKNKHIPEVYKINDRNTRLEILAGIIDSDGHYNKKSNQYEITLKSEKLIDDILYLTRSLGFSATKKTRTKKCCNNGKIGTYYQVIFYGNDINENISPIEANLRWITKTETNFIGSNKIEEQIKSGIRKKLIGFKLIQKSIPRNGYEIYNSEKELIGSVTSGTFSPILKIGIGLAYVDVNYLDNENIYIKIRDKFIMAKIVNTPFI